MNLITKWFGKTNVVPTEQPRAESQTIATADQARQEMAWNRAKLDDELNAEVKAAIQKEMDHWEQNFNLCIQHGVKNGKIGGLIERRAQPPLHPQLINKFEAQGFHIYVDNETYGYRDLVIINWEIERPNFHAIKDWTGYWRQLGTKPPPVNHFD